MIAKITDKVITNFKYLPNLTAKTGKSGNINKTNLGIDKNEPENVGTNNSASMKTQ